MKQLTKEKDVLTQIDACGRGEITVRPIQSLDELAEVYRLTHECYVENEYADPHPAGILIHYPYFDHNPNTTIFVACAGKRVVGSVSLTLDGPMGLTVDEDFKEVCDRDRAAGRRVAAVWRLVVDRGYRGRREIVTRLIQEVCRLIKRKGADTVYFSVNPKHVRIYQRILNMVVVAENAHTEGLRNAPAVLLRGSLATAPARTARWWETSTMPTIRTMSARPRIAFVHPVAIETGG